MVEGVRGMHHAQVASALFPSTLCSAVVEIVALLDDAAVSRDECSVYEVAYQVNSLISNFYFIIYFIPAGTLTYKIIQLNM